MSTWHQRHRPVRLDSPNGWTAVTDPPQRMTTSIVFGTEAEARAFEARVPHTFVLPPRPVAPLQKWCDWLEAKVGTRQWVVASRTTPRLRDKGYDVVITPRRYRALEAEYKAEMGREP